MGLLESVVSQTRERFNLGDKAGRLLEVLISIAGDSEQGGFTGFISRFEEVGLGNLASSWVNVGANMPLSYEQTESVFGEVTLEEVSEEVGLDYKSTTLATAFMVPHMVDGLTPNGEIPSDITALIGETRAPDAKAKHKAAEAGDRRVAVTQTVVETSVDSGPNEMLTVIMMLIIVGLLVLALLGVWGNAV